MQMTQMFRALAPVALLTAAAAAQCATLSYTGTYNAQKGTMFEIQNVSATTPMVIGSFEQAFSAAGTADMEIYTIAGSCAGLEANPLAWTLIGTAAGVVHTGATTNPPPMTPIPIPIGISIAPGATQSFYITATNATGSSTYYTTGTNQYGVAYASNADLALIGRTGMSYPFGSSFGLPTAGRLWNGIVHYCPGGSGTVFSTSTSYGTGCVAASGSFYENFATSAAFDLSNTALTMMSTGTGYLMMPGMTTYVAPSGTATALTLGDDTETTVALSSPLVTPTGITSALTVCSNGYVSVATGNGTGWTPAVATFLNAPQTGWWCWHDNNPAAAGSGQVKFEEIAGVAYITWDGVYDFGGTSAANANTYQMQFELATGTVHFVWQTMSVAGNGRLIGYSPGGNSVDPGNRDISATLPATFSVGAQDILPLAFSASARPIQATSINLNTSNITPTAPFGAILLGFSNPAFDLTPLGMAGCTQYADGLVTLLYLPLGSPTASVAFSVPSVVGLHVFAQSFAYDPAANLTALGAVASNGVDLLIGDF
jgi:hypothetical protein